MYKLKDQWNGMGYKAWKYLKRKMIYFVTEKLGKILSGWGECDVEHELNRIKNVLVRMHRKSESRVVHTAEKEKFSIKDFLRK